MGLRDRIVRRLGGLTAGDVTDHLGSLRADVDAMAVQLAAAKRAAKAASGVDIVNGGYEYEVASALRGREKWETLDKMASDPHVSGAVNGIVLPLLSAQWEIKPASEDPRDVEIADFVSTNLLRTTNDHYGREYWCRSSWKAQRLPEILMMLQHGFSLFAKSWRAVGSKLVYDTITWLEPSSVDPRGWILSDTDDLLSVERTFRLPSGNAVIQEPIDARDLALYVWSIRGARYEGTPFVRSMYGAWMRKDFVLRQSLIWAQKVGAPVPMGTYPSAYKADDVRNFDAFVQMLRGTSPAHAYFAGPQDQDGHSPEVRYVGADAGEVDRMRGLIDGENAEIAHVGASKSSLLGETATGSRAVGSVQRDSEELVIRSVAEIVCEWETHGVGPLPGLIEELVQRNFSGVQSMPRLCVSKISADEGTEHFDRIMAAIEKGIIPRHPDVARQVTATLGLTLPDDAFDEIGQEPDRKVEPNGNDKQDTQDDGRGDGSGEEKARDVRRTEYQMRMSSILRAPYTEPAAPLASKFRREPTVFEARYVQLAQVAASFGDGESRLYAILRRAARSFVADIVARGRAGKLTEDTVANLRRAKPRGIDELKSAMRAAFVSIADDGKSQSEQEIARQTATNLEAVPPGGKIPTGKTNVPPALANAESALSVLIAELADEARVSADVAIDGLWQRMLGEAIGEWDRLRRANTPDAEMWDRLDAFLDGLSDQPLANTARQVATVAVNQGRDIAAKMSLIAGAADWVVRSELLDQNTCEECNRLDGLLVRIGSAEYESLMPPARCLGGDRCRGFYVAVSRTITEASE